MNIQIFGTKGVTIQRKPSVTSRNAASSFNSSIGAKRKSARVNSVVYAKR